MRKILWGIGFLLLLVLGGQMIPPPTVNVTAILGGEVTWSAAPGTEVREGSEIVRIRALAGGEAVAARAKAAGVRPGDRIASGTVVARLKKTMR